jgi:hypothetical protein
MNVVEILEMFAVPHFNGSGHHHCRPGWIQVDCPYCGRGSSKFHMGLNSSTVRSSCWRCGPHNFLSSLIELTGQPYKLIKQMVGDLDVTEPLRKIEVAGKLSLPPGITSIRKRPIFVRYLRGRGFCNVDELIRLWGIKGIVQSSRFSWRIFIPVHFKGEVVSWTTRSVGERGIRYMSAKPEEEAIPLKSLLYGEDYCSSSVVVMEGPVNVWRYGPGGVATCGLSFTKSQVLRISKYPVRAICFDAEPEAQRRARWLVQQLAPFPGETYNVVLDSGKDLAAADDYEVRELREKFGNPAEVW